MTDIEAVWRVFQPFGALIRHTALIYFIAALPEPTYADEITRRRTLGGVVPGLNSSEAVSMSFRSTWSSRKSVRYVALAAAVVAGSAWMSAPTADEAAVRAALQHYIQGHATGDGAHMRIAFHPAAKLFWSSADTLATRR